VESMKYMKTLETNHEVFYTFYFITINVYRTEENRKRR